MNSSRSDLQILARSAVGILLLEILLIYEQLLLLLLLFDELLLLKLLLILLIEYLLLIIRLHLIEQLLVNITLEHGSDILIHSLILLHLLVLNLLIHEL